MKKEEGMERRERIRINERKQDKKKEKKNVTPKEKSVSVRKVC